MASCGQSTLERQWESKLFLLLDDMILDLKLSPSQRTTWVKNATVSSSHVDQCGLGYTYPLTYNQGLRALLGLG